MFVTILLIPFTIFILIIGYYFQQKWKWRSLRHINGPTPLPLLGNILDIGLSSLEIIKISQQMLNNYGKGEDIIKCSIGPSNCFVLIGDPDYAEFFLSSSKLLKKSFVYELVHPWVKNGLITSHGTYWQKRRKELNPAFHFKMLEQFISVFNVEAEILVKKLSKNIDEDIDIYPYIAAYSLDSLCETSMGTSVNAQNNPDNEYVQAINKICAIFFSKVFSPWKAVDFLFKFSKDYKLQQDCLKTIYNFTGSVIKKRRNELLKANVNSNNNTTEDDIGIKKRQVFLDLLLNATIDGKPLSDDYIAEEVNTFMAAGYETTSTAISFVLYELSRNPEIQKKVYEEVKEIFDTEKNYLPTLTDLNNLKYLELVIKESLRLYTTVPFIAREVDEEITYKGTTFTTGAQLVFFIYHMHRRPDLFANPEKFDPERFLSENNRIKNPFSYIPFSAGPRNCIGQKFAIIEMKIVISKILMNYEILPTDEKFEIILTTEINLKSLNGMCMKLKKRTT